MSKNRLEAFSDGVMAIIITVMVLELKVPTDPTFASLGHVWPEMGSYVLSFVMVGIYWNNHHHMFQAIDRISGSVMWANLHLLFWLSLLPFAAEWAKNASFVGVPVGFFGFVMLMAAVAFMLITTSLVTVNGKDSAVAKAIGNDLKGKGSMVVYVIGIAAYPWAPYVSCACYILVAMIWFIPDRRFRQAHDKLQVKE